VDTKQAEKSLLHFKAHMDALGIDFWLREGTLLAAVRDGEFFAHDKDIDVSVRVEDWKPAFDLYKMDDSFRVQYKFVEEGPRLAPVPAMFTVAHEGHVNIDVMMEFYDPELDMYMCLHPPIGGSMRTSIPADFLDTPNWIEFCGTQFRIPRYERMVLQSIYGDWRTPYVHPWPAEGEEKEIDPIWYRNWGKWIRWPAKEGDGCYEGGAEPPETEA
jgi:phosphorylcholine metabolism protein LicD